MSSISVSELPTDALLLPAEEFVVLLEERSAGSVATDSERLLLGLLTMLPPVADYAKAAGLFQAGHIGGRRFEAAVWSAYCYAVVYPVAIGDFEAILNEHPSSAVALHMLARVSFARDDSPRACKLNRESIDHRPFPQNLIFTLKHDSGLTEPERAFLWRLAEDLMIDTAAEKELPRTTVEGLLQRHWDNLIVGSRVTSVVWNSHRELFGHLSRR